VHFFSFKVHSSNEQCAQRPYTCVDTIMYGKETMRWLRLVGSVKLQVSFAKEPYKRDDILQN